MKIWNWVKVHKFWTGVIVWLVISIPLSLTSLTKLTQTVWGVGLWYTIIGVITRTIKGAIDKRVTDLVKKREAQNDTRQ